MSSSIASIADIHLENIGCMKQWDCQPGILTIITGPNGVGKSSVMDGVRCPFEGGKHPSLLRKGAKMGKAILTCDDGSKVVVTITKRDTTYQYFDEAGGEMPAARTLIERWATLQAVDPSQFLRADAKELQKIVMGLLPIEITREEFNSCLVGDAFPEMALTANNGQTFEPMTLADVNAKRKEIYDARTAINSELKIYTGSVADLKSSLPPSDSKGDTVDWETRTKELAALLEEGKAEQNSQLQEIALWLDMEEKRIDAEAEQKKKAARATAASNSAAKRTEWAPQLEQCTRAHAEAEANMKAQIASAGIRRQLELAKANLQRSERAADQLTSSLQNIDQLKLDKSAKTAIRGLENRDGELFYDDLPLERINLAQRIAIFFAISEKKRGNLGFMLFDGGEVLDRSMLDSLYTFAQRKQLKIMLTRVVPDGDLQTEIYSPPSTASAVA